MPGRHMAEGALPGGQVQPQHLLRHRHAIGGDPQPQRHAAMPVPALGGVQHAVPVAALAGLQQIQDGRAGTAPAPGRGVAPDLAVISTLGVRQQPEGDVSSAVTPGNMVSANDK